MQDIHNFEVSFKKGYKVAGNKIEAKEETDYLKPPTLNMRRRDSNGSISSERSDDSSCSLFSSSSCSFISSQEEEPHAISKSTRSRSGKVSSTSDAAEEPQ